jgi:hypothetical protein
MIRSAGLLAGLLLAGCAGDSAPAMDPPAPPGPFERPAGASRNLPVGQLLPGPAAATWRTIALRPGHPLRGAEFVVTRDDALRPTGLLKVTRLDPRTATATLLRGHPGPRDEVVLPSTDLTRAAEALPAAPPGS